MNKKITLAVAATAVAGLMALVGASLFSHSGAASQPTLQGVWRVTEVTTTGKDAATNKSPQPGLYIFTAKHYSLVRVTASTARPDLGPEDYPKATAAQLLALWGPSAFAAFSGTYELAGGKLTTRPLVARSPRPMAPGAFSTSSYKLDGNTLTITQERGFDGKPVENPTTLKLTRIE